MLVENSINLNFLTKEEINVKTAYCFITLGLTEFILGISFNLILKKIDKYKLFLIVSIFGIINIIVIIIA
mgnify:CR=1 FL=1|jgi:hypothetical protein